MIRLDSFEDHGCCCTASFTVDTLDDEADVIEDWASKTCKVFVNFSSEGLTSESRKGKNQGRGDVSAGPRSNDGHQLVYEQFGIWG